MQSYKYQRFRTPKLKDQRLLKQQMAFDPIITVIGKQNRFPTLGADISRAGIYQINQMAIQRSLLRSR